MKSTSSFFRTKMAHETISIARKTFFCLGVLVLFTNCMFVKQGYAQGFSMNTTGALPDTSAMLDIASNSKGLLIPRVHLSSITDSSTISHPAISLLVYNTNTSMTGGSKGFWYWNGTRWIQQIGSLGNDSLVLGTSTSSHAYNLEVSGTAKVSSSFTSPTIIGGTGTTSSLTYKTTTGNGTTGADHIFKVGNNGGTEAMRILNSGNVGIGTTSPATKLDVSGTGNFTDAAANTPVSIAGKGSYFNNIANTQDGAFLFALNLGFKDAANNPDDRTLITPNAHSRLSGAGVLIAGNMTTASSVNNVSTNDIGFFTTPTASTTAGTTYSNDPRLIIKASGKIGIGTTNPLNPLHVVSSGVTSNLYERGISSFYFPGTSAAGGGLSLWKARGTASAPTTVVSGDGMGGIIFGGYDGTNYLGTAGIVSAANGTITTGSIPTDLTFFAGSTNNSWNERMRITSSGNVGIGTTSPGYKLDVQGAGTGTVTINTSGDIKAAGTTYTSDRMFKTNIDSLRSALSIIQQLRPQSYYFDTTKYNKQYKFDFSNRKQYGFIAQDIEAILPELVSYFEQPAVTDTAGTVLSEGFTYRSLNYNAFIPILTKGVQELQTKVDVLEAKRKEENNLNLQLQQQIEALTQRIQALEGK